MSISYLYVVYDDVGKCYTGPYKFASDILAMRDLARAVNEPGSENLLSTNPKDFTLMGIASFDDDTGFITLFEGGHLVICNLTELKSTRS